MRYLWILCFMTLSGSPVWAIELRLVADTTETWTDRESPQDPETEWELLALQTAGAKSPVVQGKLTASWLGRKDSSDLVMVEEAPENIEDNLFIVKSFKVCGGKICGEARQKFVSKPNPENEQVARSVAMDYLQGKGSNMPVFLNDKALVVEYDGKCSLNVIEKDRGTVSYTYRYDACR